MGRRRLVRGSRRGARSWRAHLAAAAVLEALGSRAPRVPRRRHRHGHVVHVEVPRAGSRRGRGPRSPVGERGRTVQSGTITYTQWLNESRQARGRPDRHQACRRRVHGRRHRHGTSSCRSTAAPAHRRPACVRHRCHVRLRADQCARSRVARAAADPDDRGHVERGVPVPHGSRDRPRLRPRAVRADHVPRRVGFRAVRAHRTGGARVRPHRRCGRWRSACATPA